MTNYLIDKVPPQDIDSELSLLGSLLDKPARLFDVRAILDEGAVFYKEDHQQLYRILLAIADEGKTIRPITIIQHLRSSGTDDLLHRLPPLDQLSNRAIGLAHMETAIHLRELYVKRIAIGHASELIRDAYNNESFDAIIQKAKDLTTAVTSGTASRHVRGMSKVIDSTLAHIEAAANSPTGLSGVSSGSDKLNRITGGVAEQ